MPKSYFHWLSDFLSLRYFYTSDFFLCHQSCFSCFWSQFPLFLDVSKPPVPFPYYTPRMPEKVIRPPEAVFSVSSGLEIVSKLWDILFWVCCVKSDSEIRRDIGQIVLPGLGWCQPTLASQHLKLYHLQIHYHEGREKLRENRTLFCWNYSQTWN